MVIVGIATQQAARQKIVECVLLAVVMVVVGIATQQAARLHVAKVVVAVVIVEVIVCCCCVCYSENLISRS